MLYPNFPFPVTARQTTTPVPADTVGDKPLNVKFLIPKNDGTLAEVARLVAATWGKETWFALENAG